MEIRKSRPVLKLPRIEIGSKVQKKSGKPFKSGLTIATVKSFTVNPHSHKTALAFKEDDSIVDLESCKLAK